MDTEDTENEEITEEEIETRRNRIDELRDIILKSIGDQFEDDLNEDDLMDIFAALGVVTGVLMNEAFYCNCTLPYQLQGILSDFTYQTIYSSRYGLDMQELENARGRPQ